MPRGIWSGAISFGLVNVPVKVVTAVSQKQVRFHQLHDADGVRLEYHKVCPREGKQVTNDHIVKGYEIARDEYVVVEPGELESLDPHGTHTIDIESFVDIDEIDPVYFDNPYILVPDKGGAKAYALLARALSSSGHVGIARVVLRAKEYVVALRAYGDAIAMTTLNYDDEIVHPGEIDGLPPANIEFAERELKMAAQLIEALSTTFDPTSYRDTYRERVLALIEAKAAGNEVVMQPAREASAPVIDLVAALEKSLADTGGPRGKSRRPAASISGHKRQSA